MKTVVKDDSLTPSLRPRLIYENGSPVEVILSLGEYLRLLEAIEDKEEPGSLLPESDRRNAP